MNKFAQLAADITKLWTKYGTAYLSGKTEHQHQKYRRQEGYHTQRCGDDSVAVLTLLADEAEEGGLHAECQDDKQQSRVGIEIGDNTVAAALSGYHISVERHEQIVEETPHYARQTVDGCVFCKRFQRWHIPRSI